MNMLCVSSVTFCVKTYGWPTTSFISVNSSCRKMFIFYNIVISFISSYDTCILLEPTTTAHSYGSLGRDIQCCCLLQQILIYETFILFSIQLARTNSDMIFNLLKAVSIQQRLFPNCNYSKDIRQLKYIIMLKEPYQHSFAKLRFFLSQCVINVPEPINPRIPTSIGISQEQTSLGI